LAGISKKLGYKRLESDRGTQHAAVPRVFSLNIHAIITADDEQRGTAGEEEGVNLIIVLTVFCV